MVRMKMACKHVYVFAATWVDVIFHHIRRVKPIVEYKYTIICIQHKATMENVCQFHNLLYSVILSAIRL